VKIWFQSLSCANSQQFAFKNATWYRYTLECSVKEFFALGWADRARAGFNEECHRSRGETGVQITEWSRHKHHGGHVYKLN
jgi:hypothetical protein